MKKNIAIFASGSGSNAEVIMDYFSKNEKIQVSLVVSNNPDAFVLDRAKKFGIDNWVYEREDYTNGNVLSKLREKNVDFIVLAGYLKKVSSDIIIAYPDRIVNIHPALLPKYGGKGMYGMNVHNAVVEAGESISGITIHYVDEHYDEGNIIEQHVCEIEQFDSAEEVQKKVLKLEHLFFAPCIEKLVNKI